MISEEQLSRWEIGIRRWQSPAPEVPLLLIAEIRRLRQAMADERQALLRQGHEQGVEAMREAICDRLLDTARIVRAQKLEANASTLEAMAQVVGGMTPPETKR